MPVPIRLTPADAERYVRLRRRMLTESPWAFAATLEADEALDPVRVAAMFAGEHHATFAVEVPNPQGAAPAAALDTPGLPDLVAVASLTRARPLKFAHRARVWGVFVEPDFRGRGLGGAVMRAVIEQARRWEGVDFLDLGVSENAPEAQRLYESLNFAVWGREPETTAHEGRRYDEIFMTLRL